MSIFGILKIGGKSVAEILVATLESDKLKYPSSFFVSFISDFFIPADGEMPGFPSYKLPRKVV